MEAVALETACLVEVETQWLLGRVDTEGRFLQKPNFATGCVFRRMPVNPHCGHSYRCSWEMRRIFELGRVLVEFRNLQRNSGCQILAVRHGLSFDSWLPMLPVVVLRVPRSAFHCQH